MLGRLRFLASRSSVYTPTAPSAVIRAAYTALQLNGRRSYKEYRDGHIDSSDFRGISPPFVTLRLPISFWSTYIAPAALSRYPYRACCCLPGHETVATYLSAAACFYISSLRHIVANTNDGEDKAVIRREVGEEGNYGAGFFG